jgi:2-pyrone-4,6-dicarboxylate lactonase
MNSSAKVQVGAVPTVAPHDRHPQPPRFTMPPNACDCHAHVCGPADRYGYDPRRIYTPSDAPAEEYRRLLAALGVTRAVLVQPSFYGADNSAMLDAIKAGGAGYRGVAVLPDDVPVEELARLHEAGVRGVRFNIVDVKEGKGVLPFERLKSMALRVKPFGWHIELLMHVDEFPDIDRALSGFPVPVVFGHLGYVRTEKGTAAPGFQALLRLLREGHAWVKLTGPYRISAGALPHADTNAFAHALLSTAPQRVVWGTDWPHVMVNWKTPMPNDGRLADLLLDWVPDESLRHRVLVENPVDLYGFDR